MAKTRKRATKRSLFRELMSGVEAMREHREGRLTLRTHQVEPIALEQGRSKPNEQAAALIWLVRKYPDTLERLESLSASA